LIYDVVIIGAGASALMSASMMQDKKVLLIDSNPDIGAKIKVSGGGKCNITNKYCDDTKYNTSSRLVKHIFKNFNNLHMLKFLNANNVYPRLYERLVKGAYFLNTSKEIIDVFRKITSKSEFLFNTQVLDASIKDDIFCITTSRDNIYSHKLIVASGGLSYPILGASDIGYKIAQKFGHSIGKTNPALVGWSVQREQFWFKELSGISIKDVEIKVGKKVCSGDFLFTHRGCSGPSVLTASLYWNKGSVNIDFLACNQELPKRFKQAFEKHSKQDLRKYVFSPAGTFGYTKAEVTKGGVCVDELNSKLESKFQKNLYFIGEVIDVTGELGGYNLQWAFSSAMKMFN